MTMAKLLKNYDRLQALELPGVKLQRYSPVKVVVQTWRLQDVKTLWQKVDALSSGTDGWLLGTSQRISSISAANGDWRDALRGLPILQGEFANVEALIRVRHVGELEWLWTEMTVQVVEVESATHLASDYRALLADHEGHTADYVRLHALDADSGSLTIELSGFRGFSRTKKVNAEGVAQL
jgi:hypothetical protein